MLVDIEDSALGFFFVAIEPKSFRLQSSKSIKKAHDDYIEIESFPQRLLSRYVENVSIT